MALRDRSRRQFLQTTALAAGGLLGALEGSNGYLNAQNTEATLLPSHIADINGNHRLGPRDQALARAGLFAERGFNLRPLPGFDYRADVFGEGVISQRAVDSVSYTLESFGAVDPEGIPTRRRPITIAWHYGWYNVLDRPAGTQTVGFKGGDYCSWDPNVETTFNEQKNEFGISVDALSWIPVRANQSLESNYVKGFLKATNVSSRHVALLYESTLALPVTGGRINLLDPTIPFLLQQDFERMARFWTQVRDETGARIFRLDGRPVLFIFGSHSWGRLPLSTAETIAFQTNINNARESFAAVFGEYPYIVGEEMVLSSMGTFAEDRALRTRSFDAVYIYHHASNLKPISLSGIDATLFITEDYAQNQLNLLQTTYEALQNIRNRYTGKRILIIPNIAPGFAKPGLPTLMIDREQYGDFMKLVQGFHYTSYIEKEWIAVLGTPELPAPVYILGSWNEEFEGHAVFPSSFNQSLEVDTQHGFDLPMAIKEAFGWNHYAIRSINP